MDGRYAPVAPAWGGPVQQPAPSYYTTTKMLAAPKEPYPDWSRLLSPAWEAGWPPADPEVVHKHLTPAVSAVEEAVLRDHGSNALEIRPSAGIQCGRLTHYIKEGRERDNPMPNTIGATFAGGHFAHMIAQIGIEGGLPPCFGVQFEVEIPLPHPWPESVLGHTDMILKVTDEEMAAEFLSPSAPRQIVADFKGMEGFMIKAHANKDYEDDTLPDPFGYIGQLATYAFATGTIAGGALLIGVDRGRPAAGIIPRFISGERLMREWSRVATRLAVTEDPGPEMVERHGEKAIGWYCGTRLKAGYCPVAGACRAARSSEEV